MTGRSRQHLSAVGRVNQGCREAPGCRWGHQNAETIVIASSRQPYGISEGVCLAERVGVIDTVEVGGHQVYGQLFWGAIDSEASRRRADCQAFAPRPVVDDGLARLTLAIRDAAKGAVVTIDSSGHRVRFASNRILRIDRRGKGGACDY
jgi:hypothetical protein